MSLTATDLYRLEIAVRLHADALRRESELYAVSDLRETRDHAVMVRQDADSFDAVGNLLTGLQGDWDTLGPLVRAGYTRLAEEHRRRQEAAKADDEAAA